MRLPDRNTLESVPVGYPATDAALRKMVGLVRADYIKPRIRARARDVLRGTALTDFPGRVRAVWDFIVGAITYIPNPVGTQHLTSPEELDREIDEGNAGEACASVSAYAAALLAAAGIQSYFAAIGWRDDQPARFRHVALIVVDSRTRNQLWFDPVAAWAYPDFDLGQTLWRPGLPLELRHTLTGNREEGRGPMNLRDVAIGDVDAEQTAKTVVDGVKGAANAFGPWGALFTAGISAGESAYQAITGHPLGGKNDPKPTATVETPEGKKLMVSPNVAALIAQSAEQADPGQKGPGGKGYKMSTGAKVAIGAAALGGAALLMRRRRS